MQYAPYKPGSKKTLAARAKDAGLEPLALNVIQNPSKADFRAYVNPENKG
jgi:transcriptional accessory protein Tex/SPT6